MGPFLYRTVNISAWTRQVKRCNVSTGTKRRSVAVAKGRPANLTSIKPWTPPCGSSGAKGTRGASLLDLTQAMGINRPSVYAAFGSKEALFRKALDRYVEGPAAYVREALNEPTARAVVERLLSGGADLLSDPRNPRGCLAVQGAGVRGGGRFRAAGTDRPPGRRGNGASGTLAPRGSRRRPAGGRRLRRSRPLCRHNDARNGGPGGERSKP